MGDILDKLNEELDRLMYAKKIDTGDFLTKEDVTFIFETLKLADKELEPLFETVEKMVDMLFEKDHYFVKNCIRELLEYYNILDNDNMMRSRHKFYFTESRKLTKKAYFSPKSLDKIKDNFAVHRIFKKI